MGTLLVKFKPKVTEKFEFEIGDKSKNLAILDYSDEQKSKYWNEMNGSSIDYSSTTSELSIETLMKDIKAVSTENIFQ